MPLLILGLGAALLGLGLGVGLLGAGGLRPGLEGLLGGALGLGVGLPRLLVAGGAGLGVGLRLLLTGLAGLLIFDAGIVCYPYV